MPSPKSGKSAVLVTPTGPAKTKASDDAKAGETSKVTQPAKTPASSWKSASAKAEKQSKLIAIGKQRPHRKSDKPCGMVGIEVKDVEEEGDRVAPVGGALQIVPKPPKNKTTTDTHLGGAIKISTMKGGSDEVVITVKSKDSLPSGQKRGALLRTCSTPPDSAYKSGAVTKHTVKPPDTTKIWTYPWNDPDEYFAYGRGCDECFDCCTIQVFPSQNYEVEINIAQLKAFIKNVLKGLDFFMKLFFNKSIFSDDSQADADADQEAETEEDEENLKFDRGLASKVEKLSEKINIKWGWLEEEKKPIVYYNISVGASLDPLIGIKGKLLFSIVEMAAMAHGAPPQLAKAIAQNVADINFQLEMGLELAVRGEVAFKLFTGDEKTVVAGKVGIDGKDTLTFRVEARAGSDRIVSVILRGEARVPVTASGELEGETGEGIFIVAKVEINPIVVAAVFILRAFCKDRKTKEALWEVTKKHTVYPRSGDGRHKIWPRKQKEKVALP